MIDYLQLVLLIMLIIVILIFVILGIQVYFILKDLRNALEKINSILDETNKVTNTISHSINTLSGIALGFKASSILSGIKFLKSLFYREEENSHKHKKI